MCARLTGLTMVAAVLVGCGGSSQLPTGADEGSDFEGDRNVVATQPSPSPSQTFVNRPPMQTPGSFVMEPLPAGTGAPVPPDSDEPFLVTGPSAAECVYLASPRVDRACRECTCYSGPECAQAISDCNDGCWALLRCTAEFCLAQGNDEACIVANCSAFLSAANQAVDAIDCYDRCVGECQPEPAFDAGVPNAGHDATADGGVPDGATDDDDAGT